MKDEMKMKVKFIKDITDTFAPRISLVCLDSVRALLSTECLGLSSDDGLQVE